MPTEQQANEFALLLMAGLPAKEAIFYFITTDDPLEAAQELKRWLRSKPLRVAMEALEGKPWHYRTTDERMRGALDMHYSQLASILRGHNYAEADPSMKSKMDAARTALEAKLAGQAGRGDALSRFFDDITTGRVKLPQAIPRTTSLTGALE